MAPIKDVSGQRFGRTTAMQQDGFMGGQAAWLCRCDCGTMHRTTGGRLRSGTTKSCGCYRSDIRASIDMTAVRKLRKYANYRDHLISKVDRRGPEECWPWTGATARFGYGIVFAEGKARGAHRVIYETTYGHPVGSLPSGLIVMHTCDNPVCCNPRHLVLGTQKDNNQDRASKGRTKTRMLPGADHPSAKIDEEAVADIRKNVGHGSGRRMATKYGVSQSLISAIRNRVAWKHI